MYIQSDYIIRLGKRDTEAVMVMQQILLFCY